MMLSVRRAAVAALFVVLTACSSAGGGGIQAGAGPTSATTPPASASSVLTTTTAPAQSSGPFAVGTRTMTVIDHSRPTAASPTRKLPAADQRTLPLLIIYPATGSPSAKLIDGAPVADGRFPIVEFSHGVTASGPAYQGFLRNWVEAGYVVVAPTFPLTSGAGAWSDLGDYQQQPADVSFILSEMVKLDSKSGDPLAGHLETETLAVAGHSLGAITTLGFYNSCCHDARIKAAIEVSGAELPFKGGSFDDSPATPLLLIHGQADKTVPYAGSSKAFASLNGPRALLTIPKAGHVDVLFQSGDNHITADTTVAFLDLELKHDPAAWNALGRDLAASDGATLAEAGGVPAPGAASAGG